LIFWLTIMRFAPIVLSNLLADWNILKETTGSYIVSKHIIQIFSVLNPEIPKLQPNQFR
jgi:hypothetical protein